MVWSAYVHRICRASEMACSCEPWVSFTCSVFVNHSFFLLSCFSFFKCQLQSWILWASPAWARVWANTTSLYGLRSVNWSQQESKSCINNMCFKNSGLWDFWGFFPFVLFRPGWCLAVIMCGGWLVCSDGVSNLLAIVVPTGKDQSDRMAFFHTWRGLSTVKFQAQRLNRHRENFPCVGHEFGFFGTLETLCSRSHIADPVLCSSLLQRRFSPAGL